MVCISWEAIFLEFRFNRETKKNQRTCRSFYLIPGLVREPGRAWDSRPIQLLMGSDFSEAAGPQGRTGSALHLGPCSLPPPCQPPPPLPLHSSHLLGFPHPRPNRTIITESVTVTTQRDLKARPQPQASAVTQSNRHPSLVVCPLRNPSGTGPALIPFLEEETHKER